MAAGPPRQRTRSPVELRAVGAAHATSSAMPSLADALSSVLLRLWPARRHQELLLDLGERKGWTEPDRAGVIDRLAAWLEEELL